jgi:ABC-type nickel/cobalt efflux system permease component RcnA
VISSYMVANEETWTRGVVLSFASALLHALVAVVVVGIAAGLLNATAATMNRAVNAIEIVSYSLIVLIGLRLLWVKGRAFIAALHSLHRPAAVGAAVTPVHHHHSHHDEAQQDIRSKRIMGTTTGMIMRASTILSTAVVDTRITVIMTTTLRPGDTLMRWNRKNWPGRGAGSAACPRSSQSACDLAPAQS